MRGDRTMSYATPRRAARLAGLAEETVRQAMLLGMVRWSISRRRLPLAHIEDARRLDVSRVEAAAEKLKPRNPT
jgi:hypothetical protein